MDAATLKQIQGLCDLMEMVAIGLERIGRSEARTASDFQAVTLARFHVDEALKALAPVQKGRLQ